MTPEEIEKMAEEYADSTLNEYSNGVDKDNAKSLISDLKQFITFLTARFYLVEKGKVEHEMINANQNIDLYKLYPKVKYANEGVKRVLTKLFGPDIRKEEEE